MSEQTLKFDNVVTNKREFYASKPSNQAIALNLIDTNKIVTSDKFKYSNDDSKNFIYMIMILLDLCVLYYLK